MTDGDVREPHLRFSLRHQDQHGFAVARRVASSAWLLEAFPLPPRGAELHLTPRFGALPATRSVRVEVHAVRTSLTLEPSAFSHGLEALDHRGPGAIVVLKAVDLIGDELGPASLADLAQLGVALPLAPARVLPLPPDDGGDWLRVLPEPPDALDALEAALGRDRDAQFPGGQAEEFGLEEGFDAALASPGHSRLLLAADETPRPLQAEADSDDAEFGPRRRGLTGFLSTLLRRSPPRR